MPRWGWVVGVVTAVAIGTVGSLLVAPAVLADSGPARRADRPAGPALEPVAAAHVPLPAGVSGMTEPDWLPDGRHLLTVFTSPVHRDGDLATVAADGSDFRCVTCGLDPAPAAGQPPHTAAIAFGKPLVFAGGTRVLTRLGIRPGRPGAETQNFEYAVLECGPSLLQCANRSLLPLHLPGGDLGQGVQNREARISPDGRWVAWTELSTQGARMSIGRLVRGSDAYTLADVRILNPTFVLDRDSEQWRAASPAYELKNFSPDGRSVFYASMRDAENFDVWRLDLATGRRRRVTDEVEWDEDVSASPADGALSLYTSRGFDRMAAIAQVPRPPFVDAPLFTWVGRFMLNLDNRRCLLEPWLLGPGGQRGTDFGQPLDPAPDPGWDSRTLGHWSPDGAKVLFWEARDEAAGTPGDPNGRITIVGLPARRPVVHVPGATPEPRWAPRRDAFHGYGDVEGTFEVDGRRSGSATVTLAGNIFAGSWSATYHHYSDDGVSVIDGTERVSEPSILASAHWQADLLVTGAHHGSLHADVTFVSGGGASGTVRSEYDGRQRSGLPPASCVPLPAPRLRATVARSRGHDDGQITVLVTALVTDDPVARPVRDATVRVAGRTVSTDEHGVARARVHVGGRVRVDVSAAGFSPTSTTTILWAR